MANGISLAVINSRRNDSIDRQSGGGGAVQQKQSTTLTKLGDTRRAVRAHPPLPPLTFTRRRRVFKIKIDISNGRSKTPPPFSGCTQQ